VTEEATISVRVSDVRQVTPRIKHFTLTPLGGGELPAFSGGSHVIVVMRGASRVHRNPYSLMSSPAQLDRYEISVRRMETSRGGSHFMHDQVSRGATLEIAHPVNLFPLDKIARKHLLIAGGIGITPFLAQLTELASGPIPFELHYAARSLEHCAFTERLQGLAPGRVHHYYSAAGSRIDVQGLLSRQPLGTHVYVCGPDTLINGVVDTARSCGWPDSHVHWERFSAPPVGEAFDAYLQRSRLNVHVPPDQSLLESLEAAGVDVPYLCRGGVCGFCRTRVLEIDGELVHNDHFLSAEEKASRQAIMPCVSRARCSKLVLDL
jgi:dimethylamine monooxygenase subunit B